MRFQSYFNTALSLVHQYDGSTPLAHFLKQYFAQHKKHGSKDRRWIAHLCYTYFRLGHAVKELATEERLKIALFLCHDTAGDWSILFDQHWIAVWSDDVETRIDTVTSFHPSFEETAIFPWKNELSDGIDWEDLSASHLIQSDLFVRIRPEREKTTKQKLTAAQIPFTEETAQCLSLPNGSKIETVVEIDRDVVVQDKSSQRISEFLKLIPYPLSLTPISVWDCCAASGGKSILAKDVLGNIDLTVSDIRPSIIQNLKKRFENAGIKNYHAFVTDLSNPKPFFFAQAAANTQTSNAKLIICDAPCTGSGTWGRTPEQLYFFKQERIAGYAALQKKIVRNAISSLQKDGYFLYITCSVFKRENEEVAQMMHKEFPVELVKAGVLKGYDQKADSMYAALFVKK